ncbi:alpha-mannosidase, partial [Leptolyngbya sp. FACHB-36]|nr:alpha-mannosidase [Leptolyngbya sp. FACHB-36]
MKGAVCFSEATLSYSTSASDFISSALDRLRALTQCSVQTTWRCWDGDLPTAQALSEWHTWTIVDLNAKQHVAWSKGEQVRWFGQAIVVPQALEGYPLQGLCLRLALMWWAIEAQIFVNGQLVQEGDLFDCSTRLLLSDAVAPGEEIAIVLRLVSPGHDDGALVRSTCLYESLDGFPEPSFVADELAVLHTYLQALSPEQLDTLAEAIGQIDWAMQGDRAAFDHNLAQLRQQLLPLAEPIKQRQIQLIGHAHLDMAWLWTVDETWQAAERTFESVLGLQQDFPELTFCHSTPALYEWIEQNRPDLFERIRQQVAAGTWEPVGGLWVEPELNLIGGEAIVRHILYGQRYFQEKFGDINRIAWLPDTFGFNWQLPQFFKQGGIEYFVTQKLRWNDTTQFPHEVFQWQAPDQSQVLGVMSAPIGEGIDPIKMATYACEWENKTGMSRSLWLPGVGDHGGGPTRDMLELARRWQRSPFFPEVEFTTA